MGKLSRNFIAGRMNKTVDERLLPEGEYIDAMNIRMGSTEQSEVGVIENVVGNKRLTQLIGPGGMPLSANARCIGAIENSATNSIYWFVHDDSFPAGATGVCDMIVSYNILTQVLTYHVVSVDDGSGAQSTLNFDKQYLITGVNIIENKLLFFTDDRNPPRVINVNTSYPQPVAFVDPAILAEQLLVIKRHPSESPMVEPFSTAGQENYLDTRFLSFAYRYRYADGEYSATSQWSDISFIPKPFEFSINSMLNEGMTNSCNSAKVTYNSGGELVVGVDLLFKQSANNIIKVIEKIDKAQAGLADNTDYTFVFDSSKIFTILPESELLRLYDNVPLQAKAQTIMGNRLMYGNYIEGYDLIDKDGAAIRLEYEANLSSEDIGLSDVPTSFGSGNYSVDGPAAIADSIIYVDLNGVDLNEGSAVTIEFTFKHNSFSGPATPPTATTDEKTMEFSFILPTTYTSVHQMATSPEFQAFIGTSLPLGNIKPVYDPSPSVDTSCDGNTITDDVNCAVPAVLDTLQKYTSGISFDGQAIEIIATPASTQIGLQLPAMKFVDNLTTPTTYVYEYYEIIYAKAYFQAIASPRSLHSNRDYELAIIYMDDFGRSSTALVSPYNTVHVPCANSAKQNKIIATIPPTQVAPAWATRYKFALKPSAEFYETVYSNLFFKDPDTNEGWFFLEGENVKKVETGDRLIVKADSNGPTQRCVYATVLEKAAKDNNFITPSSGVGVPAGVYMKINPNDFSAEEDPNAVIAPGTLSAYAPVTQTGGYSQLDYPVNIEDPNNPGSYIDYDIPAGSRIYIKADWNREGKPSNPDALCDYTGYYLEKTYVASADYANFEDWFVGDNIEATLNTGTVKGNLNVGVNFIPTNAVLSTFDVYQMYLQFYRNPGTQQLVLQFSTSKSCQSVTGLKKPDWKKAFVTVTIVVYRAEGKFVFETEPTDAKPDVFFENNLSFPIDADGNHAGNVQDQDISTSTPAIVDTGFFNCFAFGNGVESYKCRDSIVGKYFTLGERVSVVAAQNYKRAHRFSDMTYSGIYNPETNVNRLNEFNLGLLNYKNLEASFGPIYVLDGRETDVLVLQEDKISYVLAGKNLLSDAAAGNAITSVPEVLGTQIARTEKFGVSFNPESYVQWGQSRYFTDAKRGAVISLTGNSATADQLVVVSEYGMRTWFRDEFNRSFNTQKIGGYDPYMNEYVLHSNNIRVPFKDECIQCGVPQTITLENEDEGGLASYEFCVNLGPYIGDATLSWTELSNAAGEDFTVTVTYGGTPYTNGPGTGDGSVTFPKSSIADQTAQINIEFTSPTLILEVTQACPDADELTVVEVVLTNDVEAGDTAHIEYRYTYGAYTGSTQSYPVTFQSGTPPPVVSRFNAITGLIGGAAFPPPGATMRIQSAQIPPDNFVFDPGNDKFRYLQSNTLYPNTQTGIQALIAASSLATPIMGAGVTYYADFTVPGGGSYLYLIWDYRDSIPTLLCHEDADDDDPKKSVCCECEPCGDPCLTISVSNPADAESPAEVLFPFGNDGCGGEFPFFSVEVDPGDTWTGCIDNVGAATLWVIVSGRPVISTVACGCGEPPMSLTLPELSYGDLWPGDVVSVSDGTWENV